MRIETPVNRLLEDLVKVMTLERLEDDLFRGESRDIGSPQVFGGQVLGQALMAAAATVEGRDAHSLHAYFLRRGDFNSREDLGTRTTAFTIRHDKRARPCKWRYDADAGHARYLERHPRPEPQTALPEAA